MRGVLEDGWWMGWVVKGWSKLVKGNAGYEGAWSTWATRDRYVSQKNTDMVSELNRREHRDRKKKREFSCGDNERKRRLDKTRRDEKSIN